MQKKVFFLLFVLVCGAVVAQEDEEPMDEDVPESLPENTNLTLSEYQRCRGMSCVDWERRQRKLLQLRQLERQMGGEQLEDDEQGTAMEDPEKMSGLEIQKLQLDLDEVFSERQIDAMISQLRSGNSNWTTTDGQMTREKRFLLQNTMNNFLVLFTFKHNAGMPLGVNVDNTIKRNPRQYSMVKNALKNLMEETCMKFIEINPSTPKDSYEKGLHIANLDRGCYASIGRQFERETFVNLNSDCFASYGIPVHEVVHAIGFGHEVSRPDRKKYLTFHGENTYTKYHPIFRTAQFGYGTIHYDINSVMHYNKMSGSKNNRPVLTPVNPLFRDNMGRNPGVSYIDGLGLNTFKKPCGDRCNDSGFSMCNDRGYKDPKDCSRCKCAPGFSSQSFCKSVAPSKGGDCSKTINLQGSSVQEFSTPGYPSQKYSPLMQCNWHIKAPSGQRIELKFDGQFDLDMNTGQDKWSRNTDKDWVEVQFEEDLEIGARYSGKITPTQTITSDGNEMMVTFRSNTKESKCGHGFKAKVRISGGGGSWGSSSSSGGSSSSYNSGGSSSNSNSGGYNSNRGSNYNSNSGSSYNSNSNRNSGSSHSSSSNSYSSSSNSGSSYNRNSGSSHGSSSSNSGSSSSNYNRNNHGSSSSSSNSGSNYGSSSNSNNGGSSSNYNRGSSSSSSSSSGGSDSFSCTFDSNDWCGIQQSTSDNFDWTMQSGPTSSGNTGPSSAYNGDKYIYIESSDPRVKGDRAEFSLPPVKSSGRYCLTFQYHMHSGTWTHVSRLSVYKGNTELWTKFEMMGDQWNKGQVDTQMSGGESIKFVGIRGDGHMGDTALDDIKLRKC